MRSHPRRPQQAATSAIGAKAVPPKSDRRQRPPRGYNIAAKQRRRSGGGIVAEHSGSLRVIIAAIAGNVAIAICKFGAALVTGSAAMYSEAIHSTVDTGNELLLLFGMRRADKPPDAEHPFGYGLQLYFWVFVVAVMIFGLGALVAFYEGSKRYSMPSRPGTWSSTTLSWALRSCSRPAHGSSRFE